MPIASNERTFNLPARESQHKEAPYPKSKKVEKKANDQFIDIEDKDPLWLKDKGDHFYKRNDFLWKSKDVLFLKKDFFSKTKDYSKKEMISFTKERIFF